VLPLDLTEVVVEGLAEGRRSNDFLLHPSGHMLGSLRHAQLDVAGAPRKVSQIARDIRMHTGTMWHSWIEDRLRREGIPFMSEVILSPWLPQGWSGKPDLFIYNPEYHAFGLVDVKTIKGDGLRWVIRDGAKEEHIWQTSLYWWGAKKMFGDGVRLIKRIGIFYIPMGEARANETPVEPVLIEFDPLPWETLRPVVEGRWKSVKEYLDSLPFPYQNVGPEGWTLESMPATYWTTDKLAPVQDRVKVAKFDKPSGQWIAKLEPHWSARYCEFPVELCDCSLQGINKIGSWTATGTYVPRTDYEHIAPPERP
jgi:hypothetical protein